MSRLCPRTSHGFTVNSLYGPVIHFLQSVGLQFSLKFLLYIISIPSGFHGYSCQQGIYHWDVHGSGTDFHRAFFYGPVHIEKRNIRQRPRQGNPAGTTFNVNNASFPELGHDIADNDRIISYTAGQKITGYFITAGKIPDSRQYI